MRDLDFVNGEYYHVYNRGVDKRCIFNDTKDYERFCESACLFNNPEYVYSPQKIEKFVQLSVQERFGFDGDPYVKILSYALMPNHYHFFLQQTQDDGIPKFFHKLNKGYSNYFNNRNDRTGALFEGKYKAKHIDNNAYFDYVLLYIHLNPLDLTDHKWRDGIVDDWDSAMKFIEKYPWSSHNFYKGTGQKYPVVDEDLAIQFLENIDDYKEAMTEWPSRNLKVSLPSNDIRESLIF